MTEQAQGVDDPCALLAATHETTARGLLPEHDVVFDREIGSQVQFLIDHGDARTSGILRAAGTKMAGRPAASIRYREHAHR